MSRFLQFNSMLQKARASGITITPKDMVALFPYDSFQPSEKQKTVETLTKTLELLGNRDRIFGDDFCEECAQYGYELDGTFQHADGCFIGELVALRDALKDTSAAR